MRIALVDPSLFTLPYDKALAGGVTAAGNSVKLYARRLHPEDGEISGLDLVQHFYIVAERKSVRRLQDTLRLGIKSFDHFLSMTTLIQRFRRDRPDIIHFQWLPLPLLDRPLLKAFRRIAPLVLTVHDTNPFNGDPSAAFQGAGMARCFAAFDMIVVHTRQGYERLRALGVAEDRLALLPHGLLEQPVQQPAPDLFQGQMTFLLFGKIKPYKGLDILIEAFGNLHSGLRADGRLYVVGKPYMDMTSIEARIVDLGISDQVTTELRFVADDEIGRLFIPGTVVVFPYREIEASGVLSLALAHGRPVIASALGGFQEVIEDGVQGLLVTPGDVFALTEAMSRMLADRSFATACATQSSALAHRVPEWKEIGIHTTAVYQRAIAFAGTRFAHS